MKERLSTKKKKTEKNFKMTTQPIINRKPGRRKEANKYRISGRLNRETYELWQRLPNKNAWVKQKLKDHFFQYRGLSNDELINLLRGEVQKTAKILELKRNNLEDEYNARIDAIQGEMKRLQENG